MYNQAGLLLFLALLFILGIISKENLLIVASLLLILLILSAKIYAYYALRRVKYRRILSQNKVFFGEQIKVIFTL